MKIHDGRASYCSKMDLTSRALESVRKTLYHQNDALTNLQQQFERDEFSQDQLRRSIRTMYETIQYNNGKIVLCGIGKSFKIANKLVATLNSLSLYSSVLHPSEALHGDLGLINEQRDCLVFVTASGNTPELLQLLPHISAHVPIILLTCNKVSKLSQHPQVTSLMYAELPGYLNEDTIHGLPAPTVSATLSLVLADAAILSLSELIEDDLHERRRKFSLKHPGGSIGANLSHLNTNIKKDTAACASSTSLLSLNQIVHTMDENMGSLASSDDEYDVLFKSTDRARVSPKLHAHTKLEPISIPILPSVLNTTKEEVDDVLAKKDLLKILTWIAMYNFISVRSEGSVPAKKTPGVSTSHLKEMFKLHLASSPNWDAFSRDLSQSLSL